MIEQSLKTTLKSRTPLLAGVLLSALVLTGCEEPDRVLPGLREDLRDVLEDPEPVVAQQDTSQPISLGATSANANWAQFWGAPANRTAHPALSAAPQLVWSADIGQGNARRQRITADPVVADGRIYTLDAGARVTATSTSGGTLWTRDLTPPNDGADEATGGGLAYANGRLYVTIGFGLLAALNGTDGSTIWTQELDASSSGAPSVSGDLVYLTSGDETGWAIDAATGRVRWQIGAAKSVDNVLGAPSPVISNGLALFAFGSGDVQAVFPKGGLRRWDATIVGERRGYASAEVSDITAPPVVSGSNVYVGNQSGRVVALNIGSGNRVWTAQEGAAGPIWPAGDSVFFVTDLNELVRLSAKDGSRIWGTKLPNFVNDRPRRRAEIYAHFGPIVAGGRVVLASSDGQLRSFDPTNGALVNSVEIPGGAATTPAIAGGTLYVVNANGQLLAYR
ncbi:quinoprotein [Aliishimia ponticola]|uniref:Quinoprotein n=2 Tax=Aliishimia ponticola TaxID=2499833 RepID=A0A4S4NHK0_9RHOB|nr:PQQ-like beta-propeller repeat protein [Aliishimia ponticola]THH39176.1 quinoprotein [Aliishimia ponticola]